MAPVRTWECKRCFLQTSADHTPHDCIASLRRALSASIQAGKKMSEMVQELKSHPLLVAQAVKPKPHPENVLDAPTAFLANQPIRTFGGEISVIIRRLQRSDKPRTSHDPRWAAGAYEYRKTNGAIYWDWAENLRPA